MDFDGCRHDGVVEAEEKWARIVYQYISFRLEAKWASLVHRSRRYRFLKRLFAAIGGFLKDAKKRDRDERLAQLNGSKSGCNFLRDGFR